ncbi:unnamed protein product [Acanthoscelides obtectus]|uniref:Uncharacterized protein n=1 Tax=Acanthoscelides obtectus TaxID=200917 RepID=A0A9P0LPB6_ACAOB|nr:unnamed protein product [Acanthoscelides obtectus]CAK1651390.1 hypothetical protein AOBTE_LOCUS17245 [Acanthoscelides obtectus]
MKAIFLLLHVCFLLCLKCVTSQDNNKGQCSITVEDPFDWRFTIIELYDNKVDVELFSTTYDEPLSGTEIPMPRIFVLDTQAKHVVRSPSGCDACDYIEN